LGLQWLTGTERQFDLCTSVFSVVNCIRYLKTAPKKHVNQLYQLFIRSAAAFLCLAMFALGLRPAAPTLSGLTPIYLKQAKRRGHDRRRNLADVSTAVLIGTRDYQRS